MHLLAREEIGLRLLLRVASDETRGPVPIAVLASAAGVSTEYAAKLLRRLRLGGLLESTRGATGGYRLSRPASELTVWDAVQVLDETFLPQSYCDCGPSAREECSRTTQCQVQAL